MYLFIVYIEKDNYELPNVLSTLNNHLCFHSQEESYNFSLNYLLM